MASSTIASPIIKANARFWAVPITGAGGPVMVSSLTAAGRASSSDTTSILNGHKYAVTDMDFNPFKDDVLATGAGDSTIHVWSVGSASSDSSSAPTQTLRGHTKALRSVKFHPTAANVLCSTAQDLSVRLWDVEYGKEQVALSGKLEDMVWNMDFNWDGSLLATSSREKIVRIFDPRQQEHPLVSMGCGYDSAKPQFVAWVDESKIVTIGVNARNEKQIVFWDPKNLVEPISIPVTVETTSSSVVHYPFYDESSRLLFLVGMGDRHVQSYEIDPVAAIAHPNLPFAYSGQSPISGAALLPKSLCDVRNVEIDRMLLLTPSVVDHISFSLPRTEKLRAFFQDDVYGSVRAAQPSLASDEWFAGENAAPILESLRPNGGFAVGYRDAFKLLTDAWLVFVWLGDDGRHGAALAEAQGRRAGSSEDAGVPRPHSPGRRGEAAEGGAVRATERAWLLLLEVVSSPVVLRAEPCCT